MPFLTSLTVILSWATICMGTETPQRIRRQDAATMTDSVAAPTSTICGDIIDNVNNGSILFLASDAYECLNSVPFNEAVALRFIDYYNTTMQFQSTLSYLRNPPSTYQQPTLDFAQQLAQIQNNVTSGIYKNQYAFEADIQHLVQSLHDSHVYLMGGAMSAFTFGTLTSLMTLSVDGIQVPEIYFRDHVQGRSNGEISPITHINNETAVDFLTNFAALNVYGSLEPHGDWNQIMYSPVQDILGVYDVFTLNTPFYWNDNLTFTLKNGDVFESSSVALYTNPEYTGPLTTGGDFYNYFVLGNLPASYDDTVPCRWATSNDSQQCPGWIINNAPRIGPESWFNITEGAFPESPSITQQNLAYGYAGGKVTGYILEDISVGVLSIPSFEQSGFHIGNFTQAVQDFIEAAQAKLITKIVVDLQGNNGGLAELAITTFSQLFPQYWPYTGSRRRSHQLADILGSDLTGYWHDLALHAPPEDAAFYEAGEWVITNRLNAQTGQNFSSWAEYYGPRNENGDTFSLVEQYDLANENFNYAAFEGYTPTNYLDGNFNSSALPPWAAEDVIILTDSVCASACSIFVEMMSYQAGVRTVVVGGRPEPGPMQAAAGSRGARAYTGDDLDLDISDDVWFNDNASPLIPPLDDEYGLRDSGMFLLSTGFNLRDQVRSDTGGPPLQFVYEAADCRLYWTLDNSLNMTRLWYDAAGAMWDIGLNASCVPGSTGYASHGAGATPQNAAPENTATSAPSIPGIRWDFDASIAIIDEPGLDAAGFPRPATRRRAQPTKQKNKCADGTSGELVMPPAMSCTSVAGCPDPVNFACDFTHDVTVDNGYSNYISTAKSRLVVNLGVCVRNGPAAAGTRGSGCKR